MLLGKLLLRIGEIADVTVIQLSNLPSSALTHELWRTLATRINELQRSSDAPVGFVVTQGTDTMEETAFFLSLTTGGCTPVVITGAATAAVAERFDPVAGTWTPAGTLTDALGGQTATLLTDGRILVAEDSTGIVGTGTILPRLGGVAQIVRMSVAAGSRSTGVGQLIATRLIDAARVWSCQRVVVETASHWTEVVAFYQRCGFRITHEVDGGFCRDTFFELIL